MTTIDGVGALCELPDVMRLAVATKGLASVYGSEVEIVKYAPHSAAVRVADAQGPFRFLWFLAVVPSLEETPSVPHLVFKGTEALYKAQPRWASLCKSTLMSYQVPYTQVEDDEAEAVVALPLPDLSTESLLRAWRRLFMALCAAL